MENFCIDAIKIKLSSMQIDLDQSYFYYDAGIFYLKIFTWRIQDNKPSPENIINERITNHDVVDVYLFKGSGQNGKWEEKIYLEKHNLFKDYKPIKYSDYSGLSTGVEMPISHLCELIKYLHRLDNLTLFM